MIEKAKELATRAHYGQFRKYCDPPVPYVVHPLEVAERVSQLDIADEQRKTKMICAAILHDVIEDCPQISEQEIVNVCGLEVLLLVKELTNPSKGVKAPRAVRKQMDRDHLKTVSLDAKIIKLIDRTVNIRDFDACNDVGFIRLYISESRQLLETIGDAHPELAAGLENEMQKLENKINAV